MHANAKQSNRPSSLFVAPCAAMLIGLAGISASSAQSLYTVTDLDVLPGHASCAAQNLNDLGDVVGSCTPAVGNFNSMAVLWPRGTGTVSALGLLDKGTYSYATAINSLGVITGVGDGGGKITPQGWVTTSKPGELLNFFRNKTGNTRTSFIADDGWIGGYYIAGFTNTPESWKGAIWSQNPSKPDRYNTTDLPNSSVRQLLPRAFNQSGQAVGSGVFWNNDSAHSTVFLGVIPDEANSPNGMNDWGHAVGSTFSSNGNRPALWDNDPAHTGYTLPVLAGDNNGIAYDISNEGHVIGSNFYTTPGTFDSSPARFVVWRDGGVFELQSLLEPSTGAGLQITGLTAINNVGQIVGTGVREDGVTRGIVLTPSP